MLAILEALPEGFSLLQFGVAGAALGAVLAIVVRPLLANAIKQQDRALDLLEKSVHANTEAVAIFRQVQAENSAALKQTASMQDRLLDLVRTLECRAAPGQTARG